jgi:hypothetical protein
MRAQMSDALLPRADRPSMTRDNFLFVIIGALLGFIGGVMFAGSVSQRQAVPILVGRGLGRG